MTTPERLRRRQRFESAGIAILAFGLCCSVFYFDRLDDNRSECLSSFMENDNTTGKIRSELVERESDATRKVIRESLSATSREDLIQARETYFETLGAIDALRAANPVVRFDPSTCGGSLTVDENGDDR